MLKLLLPVPLVVGIAIAMCGVLLPLLGVPWPWREALAAGGAGILGAWVGIAIIALARKSEPAQLAQAGLAGTAAQMMLTIAMGAIGYIAGLVEHRGVYLFMVLGVYWVGLVVVVAQFIILIRHASRAHAPSVKTAGDAKAQADAKAEAVVKAQAVSEGG